MIEQESQLRALPEGAVVVDASGAAWQLEEWVSAVTGRELRERWWFTVGVKAPVSDEELLDLGPLQVWRRRQALRAS